MDLTKTFKRSAIVLTIFGGVLFPAIGFSQTCRALFLVKDPSVTSSRSSLDLESYVSTFYEKGIKRAQILEQTLLNTPVEKRNYDLIIVGAGPHGTAIAAEALRTNPKIKLLIIDSSEGRGGVFSKMGETFLINSKEEKEASGNNFPGLPIQVANFNSKAVKYVLAKIIGFLTVTQQELSDVPVLYGHKVQPVQDLNGQQATRYRITTDKGLVVNSDRVVTAIGLGAPSVRMKDKATRELIQAEMNLKATEGLPRMEYVDTLLERANNSIVLGKDPFLQFKDEVVGLVGAADGGRIGGEFLAKTAARSIVWFGAPETREGYLAAIDPGKFDRYAGLVDQYHTKIDPVSAHLLSIEKVVEKGVEKFKLNYSAAKDGKTSFRLVNRVIFATGYDLEGPINHFFKNVAFGAPVFDFQMGQSSDFSDYQFHRRSNAIARKLPGHELYVAGSAGNTVSKKDIDSSDAHGGWMDHILPFSRSLGRQFALAIGRQPQWTRVGFSSLPSGATAWSKKEIFFGEVKSNLNKDDLDSFTKLSFAKFILNSNLKFPVRSLVEIQVSKSGLVSLKVGGRAINSFDADAIAEMINKHPEVLSDLATLIKGESLNVCTFDFKTDSQGLARLETLKIQK